MHSYDEIKQLLVKKDFRSVLLVAFSNSLKLKLTSKINSQEKVAAIETEINLLKGLTTKITEPSLLESNNYLRAFHDKQLETVHEQWHKNREILITILNVLAGNNTSLNNSELKSSTLTESSSSTEMENTLDKEENKVNDFVEFKLEEKDDNHHLEGENSTRNWIDETEEEADMKEEVEVEVVEEEIDEDEDMIITAQQQQRAEESWNELMDDLSADEEEVTEEVMVNGVSPDDKVDEGWNEWLADESDENNSEEVIDWNKEEEENLIN